MSLMLVNSSQVSAAGLVVSAGPDGPPAVSVSPPKREEPGPRVTALGPAGSVRASPMTSHPQLRSPLERAHHHGLSAQHIVQHHPSPIGTPPAALPHGVGGPGRLRMIHLPLGVGAADSGHVGPVLHSSLRPHPLVHARGSSAIIRPQLPQTPVQLPQTPIHLGPSRTPRGSGPGGTKLIVTSSVNVAAMLPQAPNPGYYPGSPSVSAPCVTGLLPQNPMTLISQPALFGAHGPTRGGVGPGSSIQLPFVPTSHPTARPMLPRMPVPGPSDHIFEVLPATRRPTIGRLPNALPMLSHPLPARTFHSTSAVGHPSGVPDHVLVGPKGTPSHRQPYSALQDHNYASKPPPTPPPSPPPVSMGTELKVGSSFSPLGIGLDLATGTRNAVAALVPILPPSAAVDVGGPGSTSLPSLTHTAREHANTTSIEAAGVGPMAPLAVAAPPAAKEPKELAGVSEPVGRLLTHPPKMVDDDDQSICQQSDHNVSEGEGEDTETAPEAENEDDEEFEERKGTSKDQDDSITRCICDYLHDDGYMICCDKCLVWQHVVCMGLDRNNIPDEYLCEVCKPRPIDRKKAKTLQTRRRTELFNQHSSSSEDGNILASPKAAISSIDLSSNRRFSKAKTLTKSIEKRTTPDHAKGGKKKAKWTSGKGVGRGHEKEFGNGRNRDIIHSTRQKKLSRKAKSSERQSFMGVKKNLRRKPSFGSKSLELRNDLPPVENDADDEQLMEPELDASQQVRSWIDQYEEAVTNHYSPELRARLQGVKFVSDLRTNVIGSVVKSNVSLKGNGVKILTASVNLGPHTPVIECKGKLMLIGQYRCASKCPKGQNVSSPYVFTHKLSDSLEICLDGNTYGNDSRFCRRSANSNAQLRHVVDRGSLHLFIVTTTDLEKNEEILLPIDPVVENDTCAAATLPSINSDVREIKKLNGSHVTSALVIEPGTLSPKKSKVYQPQRKKSPLASMSLSSKSKRKASLGAFNRHGGKSIVPTSPKHQEIGDQENEETNEPLGRHFNSNKLEPSRSLSTCSIRDSDNDNPSDLKVHSPELQSCSQGKNMKTSPGKLGLPDSSGLIVGVNTINYDASSSLKNKAKSREERKMEMIMKAIEQMEKAEQRKKEQTTEEKPLALSKRRRSQSSKTHLNDSAVEASSADESGNNFEKQDDPVCGRRSSCSSRKKSRNCAQTSPQRRRSRLLSGSSTTALSETECTSNNESGSGTAGSTNAVTEGPFRFPKTKKMLMSDWLQESDVAPEDDDVSASYLKGSRSPPGIATHLLRSTPQSPSKSVCSAKKRWLRQAISEDQTEEEEIQRTSVQQDGVTSPIAEGPNDCLAPLKKRRLENYKQDHIVREGVTAKTPIPIDSVEGKDHNSPRSNFRSPNSIGDSELQKGALKKKLLNNIVLEAVLDKAMQDMLGDPNGLTPKTEKHDFSDINFLSETKNAAIKELDPSYMNGLASPAELKFSPEETVTPKWEKSSADSQMEIQVKWESRGEKTQETSQNYMEVVESEHVRPPEPNRAFKSFFKPSVSLEDLEAQIEVSKRKREASQSECVVLPATSLGSEGTASKEVTILMSTEPTFILDKDCPTNPDRTCDQISYETIRDEPHDQLVISRHESSSKVTQCRTNESSEPSIQLDCQQKDSSPGIESRLPLGETDSQTFSAVRADSILPQRDKPKEKRRVSLADYKKRRKIEDSSMLSMFSPSTPVATSMMAHIRLSTGIQDSTNALQNSNLRSDIKVEASTPSPKRTTPTSDVHHQFPTTDQTIREEDVEPGTPTLDEKLAHLNEPPTLNALPLFEKLEMLEKAQKESKMKAQSLPQDERLLNEQLTPEIEPKRDNLTERLKKEFGLTVDDESVAEKEGEENCSTPTYEESTDSWNAIHPPGVVPSVNPSVNRLPTNFPTNPASFPVNDGFNRIPPYPSQLSGSISTMICPEESSSGSVISNTHTGFKSGLAVGKPTPTKCGNSSPNSSTYHLSRSSKHNNVKDDLKILRRGMEAKHEVSGLSGSRGYYSSSRDRRERSSREHDMRDRDYRRSPGTERGGDYLGHHRSTSGGGRSRYGSSFSGSRY